MSNRTVGWLVNTPPNGAGISGEDAEHAGRNAGALRQARRAPARSTVFAGWLTRQAVQPLASAAPALRVVVDAAGKFRGVIAATTPVAWRSTRMRASARSELGGVSAAISLASSA